MKLPVPITLSLCLALVLLGACKSTEPLPADSPSMPAASPSMPAANPSLPNVAEAPAGMVETLVEQNLAAHGGADRMRSVQTMKWEGEVSAMGMDMPMVIYIKRPGKMRSETRIPSMNMEVITGFDGEKAWMLNPMVGPDPQILPEGMARNAAEQSNMDGLLLGYEEHGYTLEYLGEDTVHDRPAHKLKLNRGEDPPVIIFLDAETFLESMVQAEGTNPQTGSTVQTETYMSDYRDVNGLKMPFRIEVMMDGAPAQTISLNTIQVDIDVDDELFMVPVQNVDIR